MYFALFMVCSNISIISVCNSNWRKCSLLGGCKCSVDVQYSSLSLFLGMTRCDVMVFLDTLVFSFLNADAQSVDSILHVIVCDSQCS